MAPRASCTERVARTTQTQTTYETTVTFTDALSVLLIVERPNKKTRNHCRLYVYPYSVFYQRGTPKRMNWMNWPTLCRSIGLSVGLLVGRSVGGPVGRSVGRACVRACVRVWTDCTDECNIKMRKQWLGNSRLICSWDKATKVSSRAIQRLPPTRWPHKLAPAAPSTTTPIAATISAKLTASLCSDSEQDTTEWTLVLATSSRLVSRRFVYLRWLSDYKGPHNSTTRTFESSHSDNMTTCPEDIDIRPPGGTETDYSSHQENRRVHLLVEWSKEKKKENKRYVNLVVGLPAQYMTSHDYHIQSIVI